MSNDYLIYGLLEPKLSALRQINHFYKGVIMKKILMVLTSNDDLGGLRKTGFYVPEAVHPYQIFKAQGYEIDFASPKGGMPPMDGFKADNRDHVEFLEQNRTKLENTLLPESINSSHYDAIFYVGGHGTMWDFPQNQALSSLAAKIYERGGVVAAVCHGPAGLVNVRLSDGKYLVAGKTVAAFTNAEEESVNLTEVVPFLLETRLVERGAKHVAALNFQANVQTFERLVTGQNPASAKGVAEAVVTLLEPQAITA
jgi:putative intracellular protease/amidase